MHLKSRAKGFTLLEIIIAVTLFGILSIMVSPFLKMFMTAKEQNYRDRHTVNNEKIATGLLNWAKQSQFGQLPPPYTAAGTPKNFNSIYNPADVSATAVGPYLLQTGISPNEINDDATTNQNARVYQNVYSLTQSVPLYFQTGPLLTLNYSVGGIYLTQCSRFASCNTGTTRPGSTGDLTSANYTTWTTTGTDYPATLVSTLPIQKNMLELTATRLDKIRDAFINYARTKALAVSADNTTNWYLQTVIDGGGSIAPPGAITADCYEAWYDLTGSSGGTANKILKQIGLDPAEFGKTAWGGRVEFCPDFDLTGTKGIGVTPHFGAIRIKATPITCTAAGVCTAQIPDTVTQANNVVLSF